jgi:hypothetical protein
MRRTAVHNQEYWNSAIVLLAPDGDFPKKRVTEPRGEDLAINICPWLVRKINFLFRIT